MNTSIREIRVSSEPDSSYFLRVDWEGRDLASGFQVLLTDGQKAWRGEVSAAAVRSEAEELEMQMERYVQDLRRALTEAGGSAPYSFTLTPQQDAAAATLTYEKLQRDISFRLGCVSLRPVSRPAEAVTQLLTHNLRRGDDLRRHNQRLQAENEQLRREQRRISAQLERYAADKEALEAELYSRFVVVLNEKKAKLRSLQEAAAALQDRRNKHARKDPPTSGQSGAPEDEEYAGSTDEEPEEPRPTAPDASSASPGLDGGGGGGGGLSDITDVAPTRKRRFRQLEAPGPAPRGPDAETTQAKRSAPPAGRSQSAAAAAAEDLFDDF